jgi:hypothetical protein
LTYSKENEPSSVETLSYQSLYHFKCKKCDEYILDNHPRYHIGFERDLCLSCFTSFSEKNSDWQCEFFEISVPSHYSCSYCKHPISDGEARYHYCVSDDGNVNLCVECYFSLKEKRENDNDKCEKKQTIIILKEEMKER